MIINKAKREKSTGTIYKFGIILKQTQGGVDDFGKQDSTCVTLEEEHLSATIMLKLLELVRTIQATSSNNTFKSPLRIVELEAKGTDMNNKFC